MILDWSATSNPFQIVLFKILGRNYDQLCEIK